MRFLALAVLSFFLTAAPAMAALPGSAQGGTTEAPRNFGGINCPQRVPCPETWSGSSAPSSSSLAENANSCISQFFGLVSSGDGFFDKDYGVDSSGCLTNIAGSVKQTSKANIMPHCCLAKLIDKTCSFSCELLVH